MRVTINDIKKHFKNLGYKISLKLHHKSLLIQYKDGPDPHRLNNLATYFFGYNTRVINEGCCIVILKKFIEIGHKEVKGICNRCGCQEHDACYDEQTGSCWWVEEDLCSACATPAEKEQAIEAMKEVNNNSKLLS